MTTFPSADAAFAAHVSAARERIGAWDHDRVLEWVRQAYPEATARRASDVAVLEPNVERWYVYRDGVAAGATGRGDGWDDPSLPRAIVGSDGRYLDANDAATDLFGVTRDEIIGSSVGSFTAHENDQNVEDRLLGLARNGRTLTSTAVVKRPDGSTLRIEFSARPVGAEQTVVTMRRIAGAAGRR